MNRATMIIALALGAVGLWMLTTRRAEAETYEWLDAPTEPASEWFDVLSTSELESYGAPTELYEGTTPTMESEFSVAVPEQYQQPIRDAAATFNVPPDMLARLLWQESRFRDDIVFCQTLSSAGAKGIAQFMPATASDVAKRIGYFDPCEPFGSIHASSYYLSSLYKQTGNWLDAVAAYNWGIGNVLQYRAGVAKTIPQETRDYTASIVGETYA